jgi:hypothetical protein
MTDTAGRPAENTAPQQHLILPDHDGWLYFAAVSGERGRRWEEEFRRPESFAILGITGRALPLLHRRDFEGGRRLLEEAEEALASLQTTRPSIRSVLDSIYFPLLAYYNYCVDEFALAQCHLDRGATAVAEAIALEPFLLPLAFRCAEYELNLARLDRQQRRWAEMRRHIDVALAMIRGSHPLCVLPGGTPITLPEVQAFFGTLPPVDPKWESFSRQLTDGPTLHHLFDLFILRVYAIPGFVVAYP